MSVIVGITAFHPGAAACVAVDGVPVVAIAEERINRIKYFGDFPAQALQTCLDYAGLKWGDVDHVAVGRDPRSNRLQKTLFAVRHLQHVRNLLTIKQKAERFSDIRSVIAAECHVDTSRLKFRVHNVEHHLAHNASSYFISPWESAAGLSVDGSGDFVTAMMTRCEGDSISVLKKIFVPESLGHLYSTICDFIGYSKYGDEGKVMGLAPYGKDTYAGFFKMLIRARGEAFELNKAYFVDFGAGLGLEKTEDGTLQAQRHYTDRMISELGEPRAPNAEYSQRDMDLAFGVQHRFEEIYFHLLNALHRRVPNDRLVLSGGCALNSVANGKVFDRTPFKETCIQPAASDDGLSIGAALYVSNVVLKENKRWVMENPYLGDHFSDETIGIELDRLGVKYEKLNRQQLLEATAERMVSGNVVGWFQGRMEWGPRALGNRSILVHPGFPSMKDILNSRIKRREWFRPFAPVVQEERQHEIFERSEPSPFMLHVYKIRPEWRERLSAVNHIDNTGRLQSVRRTENPLYYDLIGEFAKRTGIPVLLNTSFNENEPIVHSPAQAIDCYIRTKMDVLAIGSFFCRKG